MKDIPNVVRVWNPHVERKEELPFTPYYPGNSVDLILFDVYCPTDAAECAVMPEYLARAVETMDRFFANNEKYQKKPYGIGEWGAVTDAQFMTMTDIIEYATDAASIRKIAALHLGNKLKELNQLKEEFKQENKKPLFHLSVYYGVDHDPREGGHHTPLFCKHYPPARFDTSRRILRYQEHLKTFFADSYSYNFTQPITNPDLKPYTCTLPPPPADPARIVREEEVFPLPELAQSGLPDFLPNWTPASPPIQSLSNW